MVRDVRESGSALVECMVAAVVLATLAVGFGQTGRGRELAVRHAFEETVASRVLQSAAERQAGSGEVPTAAAERALEGVPLRAARLAGVVEELEPGLYEVTWRVSWEVAGSSTRRTRALPTRVCVERGAVESTEGPR